MGRIFDKLHSFVVGKRPSIDEREGALRVKEREVELLEREAALRERELKAKAKAKKGQGLSNPMVDELLGLKDGE